MNDVHQFNNANNFSKMAYRVSREGSSENMSFSDGSKVNKFFIYVERSKIIE